MIEKYINNKNETSFSKNSLLYLAFLIIFGTAIRIFYHYNRPFVGDEVGTLIYIKKSVPFILSHFESWLTMNYFILIEKVLLKLTGGYQQVLVLVPELAGIATIPLTAILAKKFTSKSVSLISATLVTFNPYLISYSGIIRSYSLLVALSLLAIILFFNWYTDRTFKNGIFASLACYLLMLSHLNGVYTLAYIFFLIGLEFLYTRTRKSKSNLTTIIIPLSISLIIIIISYLKIADALMSWGIPWHDVPTTSIAYIPYAFSRYFGNGFYGWPSAFLMLSAVFLTFKAQNPSTIFMPYLLLSIVLISIQGISHYPWAYARFLIPLVPILIIFISEGIEHLWLALPVEKSGVVIASITVLLIATWLPVFKQEYNQKIIRPWEQVANFIEETAGGNIILSNEGSDNLHLIPYFDDTSYVQAKLINYSKGQHIKAGKNVYFVITGANILSEYPVFTFGDIQVIVYPKIAYKDQLALIQDDLLKLKPIVDQEVSPELSTIYQNLWILGTKLNNDLSQNHRYYDLYMRSFQLTSRQKNIPLSLQYWKLEQAGYKVR